MKKLIFIIACFILTLFACAQDTQWQSANIGIRRNNPRVYFNGNWIGTAGNTGTTLYFNGVAVTSGMTYPGAGIPLSTGAAWGASIVNNSTNWNTAYTDRLKWDGGATGLDAATGRISLSLQNVTNESKATMFTTPTFTGHPTVEGVTSTGATGTGNFVFSETPTINNTNLTGTTTIENDVNLEDIVPGIISDSLDARLSDAIETISEDEADSAYFDPYLLIYEQMGSTVKAYPFGVPVPPAGNNNMTDGRLSLTPVYIRKIKTITGVWWGQVTQGNYTSDNNNKVALYKYSGGTITLVASSADDGNIWKAAANSWNQKAFSSTYAAAPGLYYIGVLYNNSAQVTAPALLRVSFAFATESLLGANGHIWGSYGGAYNDLPASETLTDLGDQTYMFWICLY